MAKKPNRITSHGSKFKRGLRAAAFTLGALTSATHLTAARAQETTETKSTLLSHEDLIKDSKTRGILFNSLKGSVATTLTSPEPEPQNSTPGTYIKIAEKPVIANGATTQETKLLLSLTPVEFNELEKTSPVYAEHARYRIAKYLAATSKPKLNGLENDEGVQHYVTVIKTSRDIDPFNTIDTPNDPRAYTQARAIRETCATETTGYRELLSRGICLAKMLEKARQTTEANRTQAAKLTPVHLDAIEQLLTQVDPKIAKTIKSKISTLRAQLEADNPDPGAIVENTKLIAKAEPKITEETTPALKLRIKLRELTEALTSYTQSPQHELTVLDQLDQLRADANSTKLPTTPIHLLNGFAKWIELMQARAALERHGSSAIIKLYPDFNPSEQRAYLAKSTYPSLQQDAVKLNPADLAKKYDKNERIKTIIPTHPYDF